ncbi:CapA family protein [Calothrix rhizosoleniae]|uniref:CapA family protein n=1 Tax=Calothrix rhizosoleniae TaxID=888997 RepID=UPI000B497239|nr:CapA family protein [Calothrix rhizosoleniae]
MAKVKLRHSLFITTIGSCIFASLSIVAFAHFGTQQISDAASTIQTPFSVSKSPTPGAENQQSVTQSVIIQAVGDVIPGTNYPNYRLPKNSDRLIPNSIRTHFQRADVLFGNLESSLTNYRYSSKDITKGQIFAFRSPPQYKNLLAKVGFNVFNIANNHTLDFGNIGLQDTQNNLESVGIKVVGHKNKILFIEKNQIKIAIIGFSPYDFHNSVHDIKIAELLVKEAQRKADIVVISMHAGAEGNNAIRTRNKVEFFYGENRGNSVLFARRMIDVGADLVIGHGPHVPRAMEMYKGKLIAYSLGNFLGYRTLSTLGKKGHSMILETKFNSQGNLESAKIIPLMMNKQGIPYVDKKYRTVKLVRYLTKKDFPNTPIKINPKGEILEIN